MKFLALLTASLALAGVSQEIRTNQSRFTNDGLVLRANGRILLDLRESAHQGTASVRILSAVGGVVSVEVKQESCAATCEVSEEYQSLDTKGELVDLVSLTTEAELLRAVRADVFLNRLLALRENHQARRTIARATTVAEVGEALADGISNGEGGRLALSLPDFSNFVIYDFAPAQNEMKVRVRLVEFSSDDSWAGPSLTLSLRPSAAFVPSLRAAKARGHGLLFKK